MGRVCCVRQFFVIEDTNVCPMEADQNFKGIEPEGEWSDFRAFCVLVCCDTFLGGYRIAGPQNRYEIYRGGEGMVPFWPSVIQAADSSPFETIPSTDRRKHR